MVTNLTFFEVIFVIIECKKEKRGNYIRMQGQNFCSVSVLEVIKIIFWHRATPTMANKSVASIGTTNKKENLTIIGKREHWNKSQSYVSQVQ